MQEISPLITTGVQIITALLSLFYIGKLRTNFFITIVVILCLNAVIEVLGMYYISIEKSSHNLYRGYSFILFNLIAMAYNLIIKLNKRYVLYLLPILFNVFFFIICLSKISYFNIVIFGAFNTSIYAFLYLRQILLSDEIINYKKLFSFWVSVGFLVFYLPSIPFFTLFKEMTSRNLFFVLNILVILMNLFIIYGLICSNKEEEF